MLSPLLKTKWNELLLPVQPTVSDRPFGQYGRDGHARYVRAILGSVVLEALVPDATIAEITHMVLEGSSKWVIGRNETKHGDVGNINIPFMFFQSSSDGEQHVNNNVEHDMLLYQPIQLFCSTGVTDLDRESPLSEISGAVVKKPSADVTTALPWVKLRPITDRVQSHVCGHADFGDIRILLDRNQLWSNDARRYPSGIVDK